MRSLQLIFIFKLAPSLSPSPTVSNIPPPKKFRKKANQPFPSIPTSFKLPTFPSNRPQTGNKKVIDINISIPFLKIILCCGQYENIILRFFFVSALWQGL